MCVPNLDFTLHFSFKQKQILIFFYYFVGNIPLALDLTNKLLEIFPAHPRAIGNKIYYEEELEKSFSTIKKKGDDESEELAYDEGVNTVPIKVTLKMLF